MIQNESRWGKGVVVTYAPLIFFIVMSREQEESPGPWPPCEWISTYNERGTEKSFSDMRRTGWNGSRFEVTAGIGLESIMKRSVGGSRLVGHHRGSEQNRPIKEWSRTTPHFPRSWRKYQRPLKQSVTPCLTERVNDSRENGRTRRYPDHNNGTAYHVHVPTVVQLHIHRALQISDATLRWVIVRYEENFIPPKRIQGYIEVEILSKLDVRDPQTN